MSSFTPTVKFELDFDGDHLNFELRRLKVKHRVVVMQAVGKATEAASEALLAEAGQAILPDCVVSMSGLIVAGQPVTDIKILLEEAYFLPLVDKVLAELVRVSRVQEDEAKNSVGLSVVTSKA